MTSLNLKKSLLIKTFVHLPDNSFLFASATIFAEKYYTLSAVGAASMYTSCPIKLVLVLHNNSVSKKS